MLADINLKNKIFFIKSNKPKDLIPLHVKDSAKDSVIIKVSQNDNKNGVDPETLDPLELPTSIPCNIIKEETIIPDDDDLLNPKNVQRFVSCEKCTKKLLKRNYKDHQIRCTGDGLKKYSCNFSKCKSAFTVLRYLRNHERRVHFRELKKCPDLDCNEFIKQSHIQQHVKEVHANIENKCKNCQKEVSTQNYSRHVSKCLRSSRRYKRQAVSPERITDDIERYVRFFDNYKSVFNTSGELMIHDGSIHTAVRKCSYPGCSENCGSQTPTGVDGFCSRCDKNTSKLEFPLQSPNCKNNLDDDPKQATLNNANDDLDLPETPVINIEETFSFPCPRENCTSIFKEIFRLDDHLESFHRSLIQCTAKDCGLMMQRDSLRAHKKLVHSADRHKCLTCEKSFSSLQNVKKHHKTCTKTNDIEEIFPCPINGCKSSFNSMKNLKIHRKSVHVKAIEKCPYPDCDKYFKPVCIRQHVNRMHKKRMKQCGSCHEYIKSYWYKAHVDKCLEQRQQTIYKCYFPECQDQMFGDLKSVQLHIIQTHDSKEQSEDQAEQEQKEERLFCSVTGCETDGYNKQITLDYHRRLGQELNGEAREECPIEESKTVCGTLLMHQHVMILQLPEEFSPETNTEHIIPDDI